MRYRAFADECRVRGVRLPEGGGTVVFIMPMPKSWSKKKQAEMDGTPHQQRPDSSNLLKAIEDALYQDDACIWDVRPAKFWGRRGEIIIISREVPDDERTLAGYLRASGADES